MEDMDDAYSSTERWLAGMCGRYPLQRKVLLCHSVHHGRQLVMGACRLRGGVADLDVVPPERFFADAAEGVRFCDRFTARCIMLGVLGEMGKESGMRVTWGMAGSFLDAVTDVAVGGVDLEQLRNAEFSFPSRKKVLVEAAARYREELDRRGLVDYPALLRDGRLFRSGRHSGTVVLVPALVWDRLSFLERKALEKMQAFSLCVEPQPVGGMDREDVDVSLVRAWGRCNEVTAVFRYVVENDVPLDDVEIVCIDPAGYVPLVYEIVSRLFGIRIGEEDFPLSSPAGVPAQFSRCAAFVERCLDWMVEGGGARLLADMVCDGLVEFEGLDEAARAGVAFTLREAARRGGGAIALETLKALPVEVSPTVKDSLARLVSSLQGEEGEVSPLERLCGLVREFAPSSNAFDAEVRRVVLERLEGLLDVVGGSVPSAVDVAQVVREILGSVRVGGSDPRPGKVHLSDVEWGGVSGRGHLFVLGMDDGNYPLRGGENPVLPDADRRAVSTRIRRSARGKDALGRVFSSVRAGTRIHLCFSSLDIVGDREMFPSAVVRRLEEEGVPLKVVSFVPSDERSVTCARDWWLLRVADGRSCRREVYERFPHLAAASEAGRGRDAGEFTAFDGHVPEAAFGKGAVDVSPTELESFGRCPWFFFLKRRLGVKEPPPEVPPYRWLSPLEEGGLLHEVLASFVSWLLSDGRGVGPSGWLERALSVLEDRLHRKRADVPVEDEDAFRVTEARLREAVRAFVAAEVPWHERYEPVLVERTVEAVLPGAGGFRLRGRVDRVDVSLEDEKSFVVLDYKTGSVGRDEKDLFKGGRRLQHALYIRMVEEYLRRKVDPAATVEMFCYVDLSQGGFGERITYLPDELGGGLEDILLSAREMMRQGCFPFSDDPGDIRAPLSLAAGERAADVSAGVRLKMDAGTLPHFSRLREGGRRK